MPERLVDVEKQGSKVLHTFPVTISAPAGEEEAFKEKALEAAGNANAPTLVKAVVRAAVPPQLSLLPVKVEPA